MGLTPGKIRTLILFSTILSVLGLVTAFTLQLSNISILLAGVLFLAHLPVLWISRRKAGAGQALLKWMQTPEFARAGFLPLTSLLGTGLGLLAWIFLFGPGSQVRDVLVQLSPVIGWGVVVAAYLLAGLGAVLNAGGDVQIS